VVAPPKVQTNPRANVSQKKKAGREVDRAQQHQTERGAKPRRGGGDKPRIGVSHRGMSGGGGGGGKRKKR
jgi:hypothetical protein